MERVKSMQFLCPRDPSTPQKVFEPSWHPAQTPNLKSSFPLFPERRQRRPSVASFVDTSIVPHLTPVAVLQIGLSAAPTAAQTLRTGRRPTGDQPETGTNEKTLVES